MSEYLLARQLEGRLTAISGSGIIIICGWGGKVAGSGKGMVIFMWDDIVRGCLLTFTIISSLY